MRPEEISVGKRRVSAEGIIKGWDALCVEKAGKMQGSDERGRRCEKELKRELKAKSFRGKKKEEKLAHERRGECRTLLFLDWFRS